MNVTSYLDYNHSAIVYNENETFVEPSKEDYFYLNLNANGTATVTIPTLTDATRMTIKVNLLIAGIISNYLRIFFAIFRLITAQRMIQINWIILISHMNMSTLHLRLPTVFFN